MHYSFIWFRVLVVAVVVVGCYGIIAFVLYGRDG
jgi:hypothetical protein